MKDCPAPELSSIRNAFGRPQVDQFARLPDDQTILPQTSPKKVEIRLKKGLDRY
jgi:hypothetical protein